MLKLKNVKLAALLIAAFGLIFITSCNKGGGDDEPTEQEILIGLLNGKTFQAASSSSTDASGVDVSLVSVTFNGGASMNFTLSGGNIDVHAVTGGSFNIAEDGNLSGLVVTAKDGVEVTPESAVYSSTTGTLTISFSTADAAARIGGIGSYDLVFNVSE